MIAEIASRLFQNFCLSFLARYKFSNSEQWWEKHLLATRTNYVHHLRVLFELLAIILTTIQYRRDGIRHIVGRAPIFLAPIPRQAQRIEDNLKNNSSSLLNKIMILFNFLHLQYQF